MHKVFRLSLNTACIILVCVWKALTLQVIEGWLFIIYVAFFLRHMSPAVWVGNYIAKLYRSV